MYRPSLNDLDAVIAIASRGSFRAAALDLGMSTTTLSNSIGKLETSIGVRLFNRTTRSVSLTDAGRAFVDQVTPALQDIHGAFETVRSRQTTPSGTLRINAFPMAAREIISPLVLEYLRRYPQVHIDLVTEGRMVDIVAERFDFGVRMADLVPSDMIGISLGSVQRYAVVGSPAYFESHARPRMPSDLLDHPCIRIRLPDGALFRWKFAKEDQVEKVDVHGPITLDEAFLARTTVLDGIALGYFMEQDVSDDIEEGRLVRVLEDWTEPFDGLCLYYAGRRNPSAAFKAFTALARELAKSNK